MQAAFHVKFAGSFRSNKVLNLGRYPHFSERPPGL